MVRRRVILALVFAHFPNPWHNKFIKKVAQDISDLRQALKKKPNLKPSMYDKKLLLLTGFLVLAGLGCETQNNAVIPDPYYPPDSPSPAITELCIQACEDALESGQDLRNGPCLLNPSTQDSDWVCDVAHDPREGVDNDPANQCSAFRDHSAKRFVEVTPDCKFIRHN